MSITKKFKRQTTLFALFGRPKSLPHEPDNENKNGPKEIKKGKSKKQQKRKRAKKDQSGQKTLVSMFTPVEFAYTHPRKLTQNTSNANAS